MCAEGGREGGRVGGRRGVCREAFSVVKEVWLRLRGQ